MSTLVDNLASLREELLSLPASTRALLARDLAESLDSASDEQAEQAWLKLAERRMAELASGAVKPVPGTEVLARVRNRNR
jgi:putative addiction module component (TIGR02574 family)